MDDDAVTRWALAAQHGDRAAATAFIRATSRQVRRLLGHLGEADQVEDLAQETYLRAFAALPRYAARSPARVWLLSIARRVAADQVRKAQRSPRFSRADWVTEVDRRRPDPDPASRVEIAQSLAALAPERREAFVLTRILGLSYADAAEVCDCPVGTIRSRVFRARADLVAALTEHDDSHTTQENRHP
jgi:RNA polymerase sigma-70 factor, ECF subfamily